MAGREEDGWLKVKRVGAAEGDVREAVQGQLGREVEVDGGEEAPTQRNRQRTREPERTMAMWCSS